MILLAGAFELVPLLAVLMLAVAIALPAALGWGSIAAALGDGAAGSAGVLGVVLLVGAAVERLVRGRQAGHQPVWVTTLGALGVSQSARTESVGGKARVLAHLARMGAPVPDALVLTTQLVERIHAATIGGQVSSASWAALPPPARRDLEAFLAGTKGKLVVRASFTDGKGGHTYAGVFPAVRDVDPGDHEALLRAVRSVVATADDPVAREYRKRRGARGAIARAVLLQRQIEPEVVGTVVSRGPSGRADSVTVDYARRRSPVRSYLYDLVSGAAEALGVEERVDTPPWMHRIAVLAVTIEKELESPVQIEFALDGGQPYVLDARRLPLPQRKTWVHASPLDESSERLPRFAQELRGGLLLARQIMAETLSRAGADGTVSDEELRYVDGLIYVDAEVLRRALARLGADMLLRGGAAVTLRAIASVARRPIPSVPSVTEVTASAWAELRAWHAAHLVGAARARLELVSREWLIRWLLRLTEPPGAAEGDRRGHPALLFLLGRRLREAASEADRQRELLEQAEAELGSAVARLLARGAEGWSQMFKGDRHLHATLEEIDLWHADAAGREALETEWRTRRETFDARRGAAIVPRVHRPALPVAAATGDRANAGAGVGVVPGVVTGPAVLVTGGDMAHSAGAILLVADPRSDLCPHVYEARGIVLLTGGLASPVAALAEELSVPVVLCPAARGLSSRDIRIDGTSGEVVVVR